MTIEQTVNYPTLKGGEDVKRGFVVFDANLM